jgi:hypothetical protein
MKHTRKRLNSMNAWTHKYENGAEILLSYITPVAAYVPGLGWMETTTKYSRATSKHISDWRKRNGYPHAVQVPQEEIDEWVKKLDGLKFGEAL